MRKAIFIFLIQFSCTLCFSQGSKMLMPVKVNDKWGYINYDGNFVITPRYDYAEELCCGFAKVEKDGKKGLINSKGEEILAGVYDEINIYPVPRFNSGIPYQYIITHMRNDKWGCSDTGGRTLLENEWAYIKVGDLIMVRNEYGDANYYPVFFTAKGLIISKIQSNDIKKFSDYYIYKGTDYKTGVAGNDGNVIIPAVYDDIEYAGNKIFYIKQNFKFGIVNDKNVVKIPPVYDYISKFKEHMALVRNGDKWGLINDQSKIILEPVYDKIGISGDKIKGKVNRKMIIMDIDSMGNVTATSEYDNVNTISVKGTLKKDIDFIGNSGLTDTNYVSERWFFSDRLKRWGLLDKKGDTIIPPYFNKVYSDKYGHYSLVEVFKKDTFRFSYHRWPVRSVFGIVDDENGKTIVPVRYLNISVEDFDDTCGAVIRCLNTSGEWGYLNKNQAFRFTRVIYIEKSGKHIFRVLYEGKLATYFDTYPGGYFICPLIDITNSFTRKPDISYFESYRLACSHGKWGYLKNDTLYRRDYQYAGNFINKRAIVKKNDKWGVIDTNLRVIIPLEYDNIEFLRNSDNTLFKLSSKNQKIGLMDMRGKVLTDMIYDKIGKYHEGLSAAQKNSLYGFIDKQGKEICDFSFNKVSDFSNNMAAVKKGHKWGYIDTNGMIAIEPRFNKADDFGEDMAFVTKSKLSGFINKSGEMIFNIGSSKALKYANGVCWMRANGKFGMIDRNGKWIIKPRYDNVQPYTDRCDLSIVSLQNRYGIIDNSGVIVVPIKYNYIERCPESGYAIFSRNFRYGFMNENGDIVINAGFDQANNFNNGYAIVKKKNVFIIIDKTGKPAQDLIKQNSKVNSNPKTDSLNNASVNTFNVEELSASANEGHYLVKDALNNEKFFVESAKTRYNKYLLVKEHALDSMHGDEHIARSYEYKYGIVKRTVNDYDYIAPLGEGLARYRQNTIYGIADLNGKILFKPSFEDVYYYGNDVYKVIYHDLICYLRKDATWIWKPEE